MVTSRLLADLIASEAAAPHAPRQTYWRLMGVPRHVGFLRRHGGGEAPEAQVAADIIDDARAAEPSRCAACVLPVGVGSS